MKKLFINECPKLIKEWDFDKNTNIDINTISLYSAKKIWWKCELGHSYEMILYNKTYGHKNCPYCNNKKVLKGFNDLLSKYPELCKEWDYNKNIINPDEILSAAHYKAWWKCAKNHSWRAYIVNRTRGQNCPYCYGRYATKDNNLLADYPELCKEWDYNKNIIKSDEVTSKSNKKIWWICKNNHSWQATISSRTKNSGCPYCNNRQILKGFNDLASQFPELCKEWDFNKNIIKPDEILFSSNKKVWWKCSKGHSWQTQIVVRTGKTHSGCPYCSNVKVLKEFNDFKTKASERLIKEWDFNKNAIQPDEVIFSSTKKIWWRCNKGHSWQAEIRNRTTNRNSNCPYCCIGSHTSFGEQSIYYYLKGYNALNRYKYLGKEIDIYLPDKHIGIEFNGLYWHKDKANKDKEKEQFFINNGIRMFYIHESLENKIINNKIYFNCKHQYNDNLEWAIKQLFILLKLDININLNRDKELINENYK